jgi:hypothetical protein
MQFSTIPTLLAITLAITTAHAVSLIDALEAAGASRFAEFIQSDPAILEAYTSPLTRTVFAPTDQFFIPPLVRRDAASQLQSALYQVTSQQSDLQTLGLEPSGAVITTQLQSTQLSGQNQAAVSKRRSVGNSTAKRQAGTGVDISSGLGSSVTILEGDVAYDTGLVHTVNG